MSIERPDLSQVDPAIRAYIRQLENELETLRQSTDSRPAKSGGESTLEITEPPTTLNVITVSRNGQVNRPPRHLYARRRRSGMGIFDLELPEGDPPAGLTIADEAQDLLLVTNRARAFRIPVGDLPEAPVRARGESLVEKLSPAKEMGEAIVQILPHQSSGFLTIVTRSGQIRRMRHHFFGENMTQGNIIYDYRSAGVPAAACWTGGDGDIFIATRQGKAIRFAEQAIPFKGCLGIRLGDDDAIVSISPVQAGSGVFLLTAGGKGTIRLMSGFNANKAPGAGGKVAIKTDHLAAAFPVQASNDLFIVSRLSKIIRFQAAEVPAKTGVVQGVHCMSLRSDEAMAAIAGLVAG